MAVRSRLGEDFRAGGPVCLKGAHRDQPPDNPGSRVAELGRGPGGGRRKARSLKGTETGGDFQTARPPGTLRLGVEIREPGENEAGHRGVQ